MSDTTDQDIHALRENIEETRGRISGEIEAIGDRLTPEHAREVARGKVIEARDKAVGRVRERAQSAYDKASEQTQRLPRVIRENPVPVAMLAVGGAWLTVSAIRYARRDREPQLELDLEPHQGIEEHHRIGEMRERIGSIAGDARGKMGSVAERARSRFGSAAETTKSRVGGTVSSVKDRAGSLATRGRDTASEALGRSRSLYENNPLVFGGVCMLAGIGLGFLLPHTQREDRVLGRGRERVVDRAKHLATDAKDVAIDSAKEGFRAARETAKREAGERDISIG